MTIKWPNMDMNKVKQVLGLNNTKEEGTMNNTTLTINQVNTKEEKEMEQLQFDLTVGMGMSRVERKAMLQGVVQKVTVGEYPKTQEEFDAWMMATPEEVVAQYKEEQTTTKEEKVMMTRAEYRAMQKEQQQVQEVKQEVQDLMVAAGVDINDTQAVADYVSVHADQIAKLSVEKAQVPTFEHLFKGAAYDAFVKELKERGAYDDASVVAALRGYGCRGVDQKALSVEVLTYFNVDAKEVGAYFRAAMDVKSTTNSKVTNAVYVAADMHRTVGDDVELAITKTAQFINKYLFQVVADVMEKPVGGRKEEIKDVNFVKEYRSEKVAAFKAKRNK